MGGVGPLDELFTLFDLLLSSLRLRKRHQPAAAGFRGLRGHVTQKEKKKLSVFFCWALCMFVRLVLGLRFRAHVRQGCSRSSDVTFTFASPIAASRFLGIEQGNELLCPLVLGLRLCSIRSAKSTLERYLQLVKV
jgi:hypothetical protein